MSLSALELETPPASPAPRSEATAGSGGRAWRPEWFEPWWKEQKETSKVYLVSRYYSIFVIGYLVGMILLAALVLSLDPQMSFFQSVYMATSAGTMTGLSAVDFTSVSARSEVTMFVLIIVTSPMLMTLLPVMARRRSFFLQEQAVARHSAELFVDPAQSREGVTEFIALVHLTRVVLGYWIGVQAISICSLALYFTIWPSENFDSYGTMLWWCTFGTVSVFHNAGFVIRTNSLVDLNDRPFVLFVFALLIMLGNVFYPIVLRVILRLLWGSTRNAISKQAYHFLLTHPRRCYTHLFGRNNTVWLCVVCLALLFAQFGLSLRDYPEVKEGGSVYANLLFMAVATRTAGVASVDLTKLDIAVTFIYTVSMYIAASPVVVSMRATTELKDITGLSADDEAEQEEVELRNLKSVRGQTAHFMTAHQLPIVLLVLVVLACDEKSAPHIEGGPEFLASVLFEFASAYGTVGLTLSASAASFSAAWSWPSQLCIIVAMFLGRLRGHPLCIDMSVDFLQRAHRDRSGSGGSGGTSTIASVVVW